MVLEDHGSICFTFVFACVVGKNLKAPRLSTRYGVSLPCISVGKLQYFIAGEDLTAINIPGLCAKQCQPIEYTLWQSVNKKKGNVTNNC